MNIEQLESMANEAIARWEDPLLPKLPGEPVVQIVQSTPLTEQFPIPCQYLGRNGKGLHVYNLDAKNILQHLDRWREEFNVQKPDALLMLMKELKSLGERSRSILEAPDVELTHQRTTRMNYIPELIQVAASAIAAIQDFTQLKDEYIFRDIVMERRRQEIKHGRTIGSNHDPLIWIAIILEELEEVLREIEY
jgi:hypothetical protein